MIRTAILLSLLFLMGCSSDISVTELTDSKPGAAVNGIPFRLPHRYVANLYELKEDKASGKFSYQPVTDLGAKKVVTLPDPKHIYVLGFRGEVLASPTIEIALNTDGTIEHVSLSSKSDGGAALTEVGTQLSATATALAAQTKSNNALGDTDASLAIAADKASLAVLVAEATLMQVQADPNATPVALVQAQNAVRASKLDANEAARKAGKPPYYPDIVP